MMDSKFQRPGKHGLFGLAAGAGVIAMLAGCGAMETRDRQDSSDLHDPSVFETLRASNSRANLEALRAQHQEEQEHIRLLEESVARLLAAEEGLAVQVQEEQANLAELRRRIQRFAEQRRESNLELGRTRDAKAELEQQLSTLQSESDTLSAQVRAAQEQKQALGEQLATANQSVDRLHGELQQARGFLESKDPALVEQLREVLRQLETDSSPPSEGE